VLAFRGPFILAGAFLGAAFEVVLLVLLLLFAILYAYFPHFQVKTGNYCFV
jgi:hypothetical protein